MNFDDVFLDNDDLEDFGDLSDFDWGDVDDEEEHEPQRQRRQDPPATSLASTAAEQYGRSSNTTRKSPECYSRNEEASTNEQHQGNSSASVSSQYSNQSHHSIYSQQSAGIYQQNQPTSQQYQQPHQMIGNGLASDFVERLDDGSVYSHASSQRSIYSQSSQGFVQQQHPQHPDDGSVHSYHSQVSGRSQVSQHSQASYHSYNNQQPNLTSPQLNPMINANFMRSGSASNSNAQNNAVSNEYMATADVILRQMEDDSIDTAVVIQAMRRFPSHAMIQEKSCALLWVQTFKPDVCGKVSNLAGVPVILDSMRNHPLIPQLQRAAFETLRNLTTQPINRQHILQAGGLNLIVEMMGTHIQDSQVQRSGCAMLAAVAEGGMEYQINVAQAGGILAVMKAVEIHPDDDLVLRAAYQALRMLGYNPNAKNDG